jgi:hypothetical protein
MSSRCGSLNFQLVPLARNHEAADPNVIFWAL